MQQEEREAIGGTASDPWANLANNLANTLHLVNCHSVYARASPGKFEALLARLAGNAIVLPEDNLRRRKRKKKDDLKEDRADFPQDLRQERKRRKSRQCGLRKEKVAAAKRTKHESFLRVPLLSLAIFSSPSTHNLVGLNSEKGNREGKGERERERERAQKREERRTGSSKSMACLIAALHERYALAAHENTLLRAHGGRACAWLLAASAWTRVSHLLSVMGVTIGEEIEKYVNCCNKTRINRSEQRIGDFTKTVRTDRKEERTAQQHLFQEEEGPLYGPGPAD
ncbi:hypothetical protein WH47_02847 [Habropoda laboriosa]|uniref:Uncharacterized protein n=1 Tax=Habropoda laboriosa TaxID=597456 RepID=A0A0L7RHR5_9HYME|nr:hypothetical protein WH47_02847 [Habropoda laboriosa]